MTTFTSHRVGMAVAAWALAAAAWAGPDKGHAFFPNLSRVHMPRDSAQILKPYLPKPVGVSKGYRLTIETPAWLELVAIERNIGAPPDAVRAEPGATRNGIAYVKHVLEYGVYPALGFKLSICWQDAGKSTIVYQAAIPTGGTFDWTHIVRKVTPPKGAAFARPLIIKNRNRGITGTMWVDNLVFREDGSDKNLIEFPTFDEPKWKAGCIVPEGPGGSKCVKIVCTPKLVNRQQALWMHPDRKPIPVKPDKTYVVELDLKLDRVHPTAEQHVATLLFRAPAAAPERVSRIFTHACAAGGKPSPTIETELVILPPLKNVRPKHARIAPCLYGTTYTNPKVYQAIADNCWRSGITWTYGSVHNNVVPILWPKGHRVFLAKPGHPWGAWGDAARMFIKAHPEARAVTFAGKPDAHNFCPTWLLSDAGAKVRKAMEDKLVELVDRDGYTAVNWDIEQPTTPAANGQGAKRCFCTCPRCIGAFRKRMGIAADVKLDKDVILAKYRNEWTTFRCALNAELVGQMRAALERCKQPIEFSVYSGYQSLRTRERYGVDWAMLAPHLDLAVAGYGGSRQTMNDTLAALGKTPFIGGEMWFLCQTPRPGATGWMRSSLDITPKPERWRNRLLRRFVDSGCNGVIIWYLPTMDGGAFYYTSEAAEIIAAHEDMFKHDQRCDARFKVKGIEETQWAAFERDGQRLLMLLNMTDNAAAVKVEQADAAAAWQVRQHGVDQPLGLSAAKFDMVIEPWGVRVLTFGPPAE